MTTIALTPAQHAILAKAIHTSGGKITWFPDHIKGGARKKVLDAMFNSALITTDGADWFVAAEGYDALGMPRPGENAPRLGSFDAKSDPELEAAVTAAEATWAQEKGNTPRRTRADSKQAKMVAMLRRPEGATIRQIMEATGWQSHTVRGALAGAIKKKLGLAITSEKSDGKERVYRIA
jgi:hypothetical protein